ncbi:hypothetical protein PVAND_016308 [Polypedilum vanderplanki]|uniref:Uncharacterized protein n=1 Tax=Polypedilum vanderplanki TaxID=319348 RepID=A0A9J6BFI4_POLVA|nr:hypothetical protein PVAND_016308 [Polypedilum vanderplanki]
MNNEIKNLMIKFGEQNEKMKLKSINMSSIINKQNENNHEKFGGQYDKMDQNLNNHKNETNQQYINLKTDMMQKFVFIALPLICLFTSLNIAIIYLCCRKYARMGNRKKTSLSNDFELQERRL